LGWERRGIIEKVEEGAVSDLEFKTKLGDTYTFTKQKCVMHGL
jgi:hypothetical protein